MEFDKEEFRAFLYKSALNYPDLKAMVNDKKLVRKSGRYKALTKAAFDALMPYTVSIVVDKDKGGWHKISTQSAAMKKLAVKLRESGYGSN